MFRQLLTFTALTAILVLGMAAPIAQGSRQAEAQFKAAVQLEEAAGNVAAAIEAYRKLSTESDRAIAAQALLRLAGCQEKLGQAEAQKTYREVIARFTEQIEVVATARARIGGKPPAPMRRLLWTAPRDADVGDVSPDGRYIAYANRVGGDGNVYLHDFETDLNRSITSQSAAATPPDAAGRGRAAGGYIFSKDGKYLAYSWRLSDSTTEVRVADLGRGSNQTPLVVMRREQPGWIHVSDWSTDGKWLLVTLSGEQGPGNVAIRPPVELAVVSAQNGTIRLRTKVSQIAPLGAFFSPDGNYLALSLMQDGALGRWDIVAIDVATGREIAVQQAPGSHVIRAWTKDGVIIFASDRGGISSLWSISMTNGVPGAARSLGIDGEFGDSLGLSASGALFYRAMPREISDIVTFRANFSTGEVESGPQRAAAGSVGSNVRPTFPLRGRRFAYVSDRPGGERIIVVQSMDTSDIQQLRPNLKSFDACGWSPDGEALLCRGERFSASQGIYRIDARTGATSLVLRTAGYLRQMSMDGRKIYVDGLSSSDGTMQVIEHDLAAGTQRELFRGAPGGESRLALSADARTVFYRSPLAYGSNDLVARDVMTGKETTLVSKAAIGGLTLSPDGQFIASSTFALLPPRPLLLIRTDGTGVQDFGPDTRFLEWCPDSRSFIAGKPAGVAGPRPTLWWIPVDGRAPRQLNIGDVPIELRRFASPIILPGWKELAIGAQTLALTVHDAISGPDQIWVLENFLPAVKR
jgi:Tol biopolymer transport system component